MTNIYGHLVKFVKKGTTPFHSAVIFDDFNNVIGFSSSHKPNGDLVNAAIANIDRELLKNAAGYINYITSDDRSYLTYKHKDFASKYNLNHRIYKKNDDYDVAYDWEFWCITDLIKKFEGSEFYSQFSNLEEFNVVFGNFLRLERCKKYLDSMQDKDVKEMLENFLEISLLSICNKVGDFRLLKNDLNLGFEAKLRPEKLIDIKIHQFGSLA